MKYPKITHQKIAIGLTIAIVLTLLSVSGAMAVLVTIDTTNNNGTEWGAIQVFQTDASGDQNTSCSGADGRDDIIETKVASGPAGGPASWMYLRLKTAQANALAVQGHIATAYLDCNADGLGDDPNENSAIYRPTRDEVILCDGNEPNPVNCIGYGEGTINDNPNLGERPATNGPDTVEWRVPIADMATLCQTSTINIRFRTVLINTTTGAYVCEFDNTSFNGFKFNVPTAIKLSSLQARNADNSSTYLFISGAALLAAISFAALGWFYFRRQNI